jgi:hypothetical protein
MIDLDKTIHCFKLKDDFAVISSNSPSSNKLREHYFYYLLFIIKTHNFDQKNMGITYSINSFISTCFLISHMKWFFFRNLLFNKRKYENLLKFFFCMTQITFLVLIFFPIISYPLLNRKTENQFLPIDFI